MSLYSVQRCLLFEYWVTVRCNYLELNTSMPDADWRYQYFVLMQFAEVNILRASGKEEEARTLKASVSTLKNQNNDLEKQVYVRFN